MADINEEDDVPDARISNALLARMQEEVGTAQLSAVISDPAHELRRSETQIIRYLEATRTVLQWTSKPLRISVELGGVFARSSSSGVFCGGSNDRRNATPCQSGVWT